MSLLICSLCLVFSNQSALGAEAVFKIGNSKYMVNEELREDTAPYIKNGRTYLPLRYAAYAAGIGDNSIYWDGATKTVFLAKNNEIISVRVGEQIIISDTMIKVTDAPAELVNGRVMLPLRAVTEALRCNVEWDANNQQVIVRPE